MFLASGILVALLERVHSGAGQVIDGAMVDGIAQLSGSHSFPICSDRYEVRASGWMSGRRTCSTVARHTRPLTAVPTIDTLRSVPSGRSSMLRSWPGSVLMPMICQAKTTRGRWPELRLIIGDRIAAKTRDEWARIFEGTDACATPVLSMDEAPRHPHLADRGVFKESDGVLQPAPAPRFSRSAADPQLLPIETVAIEAALNRWEKG